MRPIVGSGAWFHVMNRAEGGGALFRPPESGATFVATLGRTAERFPVDVHAYCAMGTHYHLLVRAREPDLLRAIASLERSLAGPLARARLRRMALGRHLLQVTRYIHRNPVDAGLVARPEDWPWSSYHGYLRRLDAPPWLRTEAVLGWLGSYGPRLRYRRYVEEARSSPGSLREGPAGGWSSWGCGTRSSARKVP